MRCKLQTKCNLSHPMCDYLADNMLPSAFGRVLLCCRLHLEDPALCGLRLPQAFHALVPQLLAPQDGVRFGTQQALKNLINDCIDSDMMQAAVSRAAVSGGAPAPLQSIVAAVAGSLGARYQDAWTHSLPGVQVVYTLAVTS